MSRTEKMVQEVEEFFKDSDDATVRNTIDSYRSDMDAEIAEDWLKTLYYVMLRMQGTEHVWASMSACRKCGRQKGSDTAFWEHARSRMENMSPYMRNLLLDKAAKAGISTTGKFHMGGLGPPDDPKAWVSDTSDIKKVCVERNYSCEGHVNHEGTEVPPKQIPLADDLIDEMVQLEREVNPDTDAKCKRDPREIDRLKKLVVEKYAPPKSKQRSF
jgi:hypothetical protein